MKIPSLRPPSARLGIGLWLFALIAAASFAFLEAAQAQQTSAQPAASQSGAQSGSPSTLPLAGAAVSGSRFEFSGSGFLTLGAGKILRGSHDAAVDQGYNCPCYIADYAQNGVYESGRVRVGPDSRLGYQGTMATANRRFSVTGQIVSRGAADGAVNLEWLYGSYDIDSELTLQFGRKRLPLFAYSEVQDVGFAIPWTHLPPQLYGWEVVNYNGASLTHRKSWGHWASNVTVFAGAESARDSGYWRIYNGKDSRTDVRWSNILGAEFKVNRGGFDARYVYMQSYTQNKIVSNGDTEFSDRKRQRIHGLSFAYELGKWVTRAEFLSIDRTEDYGRDHSQLYAVGYRWGRFTPMLSYSNYRQTVNDPSLVFEAHDTRSFVLRYDVSNSSALKIQYDHWRDRSGEGFLSMHGDSHLLSVSYDLVF